MVSNCAKHHTLINKQEQLQQTFTGKADLSYLFSDPHEISYRKK